MNNEPVAWMLADKEAEHIRSIMAVQHDFVPEGCVEIPLYTHQYERPHNTVLVPCDKLAEMQAEIERLQRLCESYIRSDYEGTSMFKPFMEELYGKVQEK